MECRLGGAGRCPEHPYAISGVGESVYMHYMTCHKELGGSPHAHRTVKQWKESQRVR